jgi:hypothetical protein
MVTYGKYVCAAVPIISGTFIVLKKYGKYSEQIFNVLLPSSPFRNSFPWMLNKHPYLPTQMSYLSMCTCACLHTTHTWQPRRDDSSFRLLLLVNMLSRRWAGNLKYSMQIYVPQAVGSAQHKHKVSFTFCVKAANRLSPAVTQNVPSM